ncbi:hypothetical protein [Rhodococcus sp. 27YEA15]|uniref:hypothetical protein n=1 Tax=Rhodococcus sp. 27YEA15 TaxID=3156259 RepID=UPI003C7AEFB9
MPDENEMPPTDRAWSQAQPPDSGYYRPSRSGARAQPQAFPSHEPPQDPEPPRRNGWAITVGVLATVAVLSVFGAFAWVLWPKNVPDASAGGSVSGITSVASATPGPTVTTTAKPTTTPPTRTTLPTTTLPSTTLPSITAAPAAAFPAGASPCTPTAAGTSGFRESATGSANTSCQFAEAVRAAFPVHSADGSSSISARSPVTGKDYRMTCTTAAGVSTCRGGDGAIVYLK